MTAISTRSVQQLSPDESETVAVQWRKLLGGLAGRIEPVPVGIMYRLGLLLVAATMIVLPIVYLALIALAGYGVYWYAINATVMFEAGVPADGAAGARACSFSSPISARSSPAGFSFSS